MFEIKISRCMQLSSGVSEDVWNSDFIFMENVIFYSIDTSWSWNPGKQF